MSQSSWIFAISFRAQKEYAIKGGNLLLLPFFFFFYLINESNTISWNKIYQKCLNIQQAHQVSWRHILFFQDKLREFIENITSYRWNRFLKAKIQNLPLFLADKKATYAVGRWHSHWGQEDDFSIHENCL